MTANVRCVGQPRRGNLWDPPYRPPCGWEGKRYGFNPLAASEDRIAIITKEPCPECGGQVEAPDDEDDDDWWEFRGRW